MGIDRAVEAIAFQAKRVLFVFRPISPTTNSCAWDQCSWKFLCEGALGRTLIDPSGVDA
jgi:hypothetical protein